MYMTGGGWAGTVHAIDPTSGIAFAYGVQVAPPPDVANMEQLLKLEALIYSGLGPKDTS